MNQEEANKLNKEGGMILILDFPESYVLGIDLKFWHIGKNFMGLKMIPKGAHFLYYNAISKNEESTKSSGIRSGFFFTIKEEGEVIVKRWNDEIEDLEEVEEEESGRYALGAKNFQFDSNLGPYPFDQYQKWKELSLNLELVLPKLEPVTKKISPLIIWEEVEEENKDEKKKLFSSKTQRNEFPQWTKEEIERDPPNNKNKIFWTEIPEKMIPKDADPKTITKLNLDKSYLLDHLLSLCNNSPKILIGEFQFSFLIFFLGFSFEGFKQWKKFIILFCNSFDALETKSELYESFIDSFKSQMEQVESEFFIDQFTQSDFLEKSFGSIFQEINDPSLSIVPSLKTKLLLLKSFLEKKFQLSFDLDDDEDMPQIVSFDD